MPWSIAGETYTCVNSVTDQRYTWHGRWDEEDHEGHEDQADGWANRAHEIWERRDYRDVELVFTSGFCWDCLRVLQTDFSLCPRQEHDRVDRQHAWGKGMLAGYSNEDDEEEEEGDAFEDDDEYTGGIFPE